MNKIILFIGFVFASILSQAAPGEFTCATLKKDDGSSVVQQYLADNCSTNRPFSMTTAKDGAPVVCCIGKQQ